MQDIETKQKLLKQQYKEEFKESKKTVQDIEASQKNCDEENLDLKIKSTNQQVL